MQLQNDRSTSSNRATAAGVRWESFSNVVAIDGEQGYMYVTDGFYAKCLALPE